MKKKMVIIVCLDPYGENEERYYKEDFFGNYRAASKRADKIIKKFNSCDHVKHFEITISTVDGSALTEYTKLNTSKYLAHFAR